MSLQLLIFLVFYSGMSIFGLYKLKAATSIFTPGFLGGFVLYGIGFLIWLYMLRKFPLHLIFPLCSSFILIGTQVAGYFLLGETFSLRSIIAVLLATTAAILLYLEL